MNSPSPTVVIRKRKTPTGKIAVEVNGQSLVPPQPKPVVVKTIPQPKEEKAKGEAVPTQPKSPYSKLQRRNYKKRQELLTTPEFQQIAAAMVQRWPQIFDVTKQTIRPLAVGIAEDLIKAFPECNPRVVKVALEQWFVIHRGPYWKALIRGGFRYDLEGKERGEVSTEQVRDAEKKLQKWKTKLAAITKWKAERKNTLPQEEQSDSANV